MSMQESSVWKKETNVTICLFNPVTTKLPIKKKFILNM